MQNYRTKPRHNHRTNTLSHIHTQRETHTHAHTHTQGGVPAISDHSPHTSWCGELVVLVLCCIRRIAPIATNSPLRILATIIGARTMLTGRSDGHIAIPAGLRFTPGIRCAAILSPVTAFRGVVRLARPTRQSHTGKVKVTHVTHEQYNQAGNAHGAGEDGSRKNMFCMR